MERDSQFEQIREEIEAKQRAILWPDTLKAGGSVDGLLWKGDPKAKPVQRAGMIVFGVMFGGTGILGIAACLVKTDAGWIARLFGFLIGSASALISIRLFRNAFLRQKAPHKQ